MRAVHGLALVLTLAVLVPPATALAVPPPPSRPSDQEVEAGRTDRDAKAGRVGELASRLARVEARLIDLRAAVELKMEDANKARVDLEAAEEVAALARAEAAAARREADAAAATITRLRQDIDDFAAASFRQGSTVGSISAFIGATSRRDLLARAQLLNAVSGSQVDALERVQRARTEQANKDSVARAALAVADARQADAEQAKRAADEATRAAERARRDQEGEAARIEADKAETERQLTEAQARVGGLESQLQRYREWQAAKQREDEERARQAAAAAAAAAANRPGTGQVQPVRPVRPVRPAPSRPAAGGGAATVIARALSQLGVPYAWGGGDANGPTRGIRDGGIADAFGDYNKVGFDCSGLMIYAFAGVGIRLPHYSGYQAVAGRQVPLNQKAPGDMLFWATGGRIHHVALYIGNEQMVEAPYSGSRVRIAPVRYGGIVPHVTRVL